MKEHLVLAGAGSRFAGNRMNDDRNEADRILGEKLGRSVFLFGRAFRERALAVYFAKSNEASAGA